MGRRKRKRNVLYIVLFVLLAWGGTVLLVNRTAIYNSFKGKKAVHSTKWDKHAGGKLPALKHPSILIEKSQRWLVVYDGGKVVKSYRMGLGFGRGDKTREGDGCTPEGEFYVCVKNPSSKFTLSLGLSYPNIEDADRGLKDGLINRAQHEQISSAIRAKRKPPWKTALGGEIMIHGAGASRDWTAGCVALDDRDIRELFAQIPLGTKVEIRP